jgi:hypothetical protein
MEIACAPLLLARVDNLIDLRARQIKTRAELNSIFLPRTGARVPRSVYYTA